MIEKIHQRNDNLVEFRLAPGNDFISCQVEYNAADGQWLPAALVPSLDPEDVLNGCGELWEEAHNQGIVRLSGMSVTNDLQPLSFYWNPYGHHYDVSRPVSFRMNMITVRGSFEQTESIQLQDLGTVYLDDWDRFAGGSDWEIRNNRYGSSIGMKLKEALPPIRIEVPVSGEYDLYFGMESGSARFLVKVEEGPRARFMTNGYRYLSHFAGKKRIETYFKRVALNGGYIEISQLKETVVKDVDFGRLCYVKLVPVRHEADCLYPPGSTSAVYGKLPDKDLCLFYEPYSYSIHGFHNAQIMNEVMLEEFKRLKPREISCQTVRIGMKSLHHSRSLERIDLPAEADDKTVNDDPARLAANCDILEETARYLQGSGIRLTANIGMNRPYLWIPQLSEKFTREHPDLVQDGDFDYTRTEVREYAKTIIGELIQHYEIDGMLLDYMRSFKNQTADTIIDIVRYTRARLSEKEAITGRKMELKVRIPAVHPEYFKAMGLCVKERLLDGIIPSNFMTSQPSPPIEHYVYLCAGTETRVYGCIDGWKWLAGIDQKAGAWTMAHTPSDLIKAYSNYEKKAADGIFIYQADLITANPYLNDLFS